MAGGNQSHGERIAEIEQELQFNAEKMVRILEKFTSLESTMQQLLTLCQNLDQGDEGIDQRLQEFQVCLDTIRSQLNRQGGGNSQPCPVNASQTSGQPANGDLGSGDEASSWLRRHVKINFPVFSHGDPFPWLVKAEQYFELYGIPEEFKIRLAACYLDGHAIHWFQFMKRYGKIVNWNEFSRELKWRFGLSEEGANEALCKLKQTGRLADYLREFERLSCQVSGWPEMALMGTFVGGLRDDIRAELKVFKPGAVREAVELAIRIDDKLVVLRKLQRSLADGNGMQNFVNRGQRGRPDREQRPTGSEDVVETTQGQEGSRSLFQL